MTCPRLGPRAIDNIGTKVLVNKMLQKQWCHEQKLFPPSLLTEIKKDFANFEKTRLKCKSSARVKIVLKKD